MNFRYDVMTAAESAAERWTAARTLRGEHTSDEEKTEYINGFLAAQAELEAERGKNS